MSTDDGASASTLRRNESIFAVVSAIVLVVSAVVLLFVRTGDGAPAHPTIVWPVLALVAGVAMAATVRLGNRLVSASLGFLGAFVISLDKTPKSVAGVKTAGFALPALFAIVVYFRQSRQDRAARQGDRAARRRGAPEPEPSPTRTVVGGRGRPTGRYTPPKDRTPPSKSGRRR